MRVLRHTRRLGGGGSSALKPTEAGIAVTNHARHLDESDYHAAMYRLGFDEQSAANRSIAMQQATAPRDAIVVWCSNSAPKLKCTFPRLGSPAGQLSERQEPALVHPGNTRCIHGTERLQSTFVDRIDTHC